MVFVCGVVYNPLRLNAQSYPWKSGKNFDKKCSYLCTDGIQGARIKGRVCANWWLLWRLYQTNVYMGSSLWVLVFGAWDSGVDPKYTYNDYNNYDYESNYDVFDDDFNVNYDHEYDEHNIYKKK